VKEGVEGKYIPREVLLTGEVFCGRMPFLSTTSAKDNHWTSSFLQQPTDSQGKGHYSLLCLLSDVSILPQLKRTMNFTHTQLHISFYTLMRQKRNANLQSALATGTVMCHFGDESFQATHCTGTDK